MMTTKLEKNILVVILDTSLTNSIICDEKMTVSEYLDTMITFVNCYLALNYNNNVAVIVTDCFSCEMVFPSENNSSRFGKQLEGQCETFANLDQILRKNISEFIIKNAEKEIVKMNSLISAAASLALCYIARLQRENVSSKINSRILLITGCEQNCDKYITVMNVIFAAQKQNVIIDVCSLQNDVEMLQKASDMTGGVFFKIPNARGLLIYLLSIFLPDPSLREKMLAPVRYKLDYRPFCYCHKELVDIGYICSICLSVFCKFTPICTMCETVFKQPVPFAMRPKKKKLKDSSNSNQ